MGAEPAVYFNLFLNSGTPRCIHFDHEIVHIGMDHDSCIIAHT